MKSHDKAKGQNKNDRQDESRRVEVRERPHIADILERAPSELVCFLMSREESKKRQRWSIYLGWFPFDCKQMSRLSVLTENTS